MSGIRHIFWREMRQYFTSPIAYLVAFGLLFVTGLLFLNDLTTAITVRAADPAIIPSFLSLALVFLAPLLTMRLLAEETREGTLELLLTAPISDFAIVTGKFLGVWCYYSLLLGITFCYQFILASVTQPDMGHAVCAYLGIWLYGGATLAVGLAFSALTENQIIAAFLGISTLLLLWLAESIGNLLANIDLAYVVRLFTLQGHFNTSFAAGIIRLEDVAYLGGIIVVMLYVTVQLIASRRWR